MRNPELLTIGKVADRGGVRVQTIRYYERGLLPKPARTASGYRKYSDERFAGCGTSGRRRH